MKRLIIYFVLFLALWSSQVLAGAPGFLVIDTVGDVEIYIDEELKGVTVEGEIFVVSLSSGDYDLLTKKEGYHDQRRRITIRAAESTTVRLQLERVEVLGDVLDDEDEELILGMKTGTVEVRSVPQSGAQIKINQVTYGDTNQRLSNFPIGELDVEIIFNTVAVQKRFFLSENETLLLLANYALSPPELMQLFDVQFEVLNPVEGYKMEIVGDYGSSVIEDWSSPMRLMGAEHTIRFTDGEDYLAFEERLILQSSGQVMIDIPTQHLAISPEGPIVMRSGESVSLEAVVRDRDGAELDLPIYWSVAQGEGTLSADMGSEVMFDTKQGGVIVVEARGGHTYSRITLDAPYAVSGRVVDESGRGMGQVAISFGDSAEQVATDNDGFWMQQNLRGEVAITPIREDFRFYPETAYVIQPQHDVLFSERVDYDLSGRVVDEEGRGIENILIHFGDEFSSAITDARGYWSASELSGQVTVAPEGDYYAFKPAELLLDGPDSNIEFVGELLLVPGMQSSHEVDTVAFNMRLAPPARFPIGIDDSSSATVDHYFWIAETPVTYELWEKVRVYASREKGYTFANTGSGSGQRPVTQLSWYDSIVWCNALSEMLGLDPVYTIGGEIVRRASGINHTDVVAEDRDGFRLPTSMEWELAARYKGSDSSHGAIEHPAGSGNFWTPGSYASGATADYNNAAATQAAGWYDANSGGRTQNVGQKPSGGNGLGLFDTSGNIWEWCFTQSGSYRVLRGGSWYFGAFFLQVGYVLGFTPGNVSSHGHGFRFLRTHF